MTLHQEVVMYDHIGLSHSVYRSHPKEVAALIEEAARGALAKDAMNRP